MSDDTGELMRQALGSLRGGNPREALKPLARVLERDENHFDALQLLGVAHLEMGQPSEAIPYFRRALAVRGGESVVHDNLGNALRMIGEVDAAIESHRRAIALKPGVAGPHNNLGIACRRAGRLEEAVEAYRQAVSLEPKNASVTFNLGNVLLDLGRLDEAALTYQQAIDQRPGYVDAWYNLACTQAQRREVAAAVHAFEQVMQHDSNHALGPARLGAFLVELGRFDEAEKWLEKAVRLNPTDADVLSNRGALKQAVGDYDAAIESCQRAIQIDPGHPDASWNLALALLTLGRYREGWHFHEQRPGVRSRGPVLQVGEAGIRRWRGESLKGRRILLLPEQGIGDQIMSLRFIPELQRRGAIVDLVVSPSLLRLARSVRGAAWVGIQPREGAPRADSWNFLMSLPAMLGLTPESIPGEPYLKAPEDRVQHWAGQPWLAPGRTVRAGIAWAGNPAHANDRNRSISPKLLAPLASLKDVTLVNLQKGVDQGTLDRIFGAGRVVNPVDQLGDMAETAALIQSLDVVVTVDTAVAHLAGSMGRPVWTLLPAVPDWRWMLQRTDTPWYPGMVLFRQPRRGAWEPVIESVRGRLAGLARAKSPLAGRVREGIKLLQSGKMAEATGVLGEVLESEPDHCEASHYLGVALLCQGKNEEGVERIRHALSLDPSDAAAHQNVGNGYRALKAYDQALASYGRAIELKQDFADAIENRAHLLRDRGRFKEAEKDYRRLLKLNPERATAWDGLGCAVAAMGRPGEAIEAFQQALDRKPGDESALTGLGRALTAQGKPGEAVRAYEEAYRRQPNSPQILNHLGNALRSLKRYDKALEAYRAALALKPDSVAVLCNLSALHATRKSYEEGIDAARQALALSPGRVEALNNLGNALHGLDRHEEAEAAYREAIEKDPKMVELYNNLGLVKFQKGHLEEAHALFDQAIAQSPDYDDARWNKSLACLLQGRFDEGWPLFEYRFSEKRRDKMKSPKVPGCERWKGEDLEGKKLLLTREQGLGDQIQFLRYVPVLARLGVTVDLALAPELAGLAATVAGVRNVLPAIPASCAEYDRWATIMSIPAGIQARQLDIPRDVPYITAPADRVAHWATRLKELAPTGKKIGIAWAGNPDHPFDRLRSMKVDQLVPLLDAQDVTFLSLQKGPKASTVGVAGTERIVSLDAELTSFVETAAVLENLDLVISVDTSVIHLAGALGRPVWTMIARAPDWRWRLEGRESEWYPTLRLFRQPNWGDWAPVVEDVKRELGDFLAR